MRQRAATGGQQTLHPSTRDRRNRSVGHNKTNFKLPATPKGSHSPRKCQKQGLKIQIKKKETVASPHHPTTGLSSSVGRTNRRNYSSRDQNNRGLQAGQATEDTIPNSTQDSVSTAPPATTPTAASPRSTRAGRLLFRRGWGVRERVEIRRDSNERERQI